VSAKISKFIDQAIWFSYLALAIVTPLIFSTKNSELFEVPKMIFVYLAAAIIFFLTLSKFILQGKITVPKNWAIVTFLIFIVIQVLSTLFSIDKFTSIFGYPSRLNGGLLSQFAYFAIFTGAFVNLNSEKSKKLLMAIVTSAFAVTLWGIPAHFGKDPSCLVLTGTLNSSCWQKEFDPTVRIFSTLGQPNWLASYLVLTLPIALAFSLISTQSKIKVSFLAITLVLFTGLIMTTSRAGFLGAAIALGSILLLLGFKAIKQNLRLLLLFLLGFILIAVIFGTNLFSRFSEALNKQPATSNQLPATSYQQPATTPTESGTIRIIVWQGALSVFKHWPVLGSGPETFAYSYYLFRPTAHNQTTEWGFFYNKAHNEFLNYLANLGILGTVSYLALIGISVFGLWRFSRKLNSDSILAKAAIGSIFGYQATIFFGFSVVTTQLLMFLIIASFLIPEIKPPPFYSSSDSEKLKVSSRKSSNNIGFFISLLTIVIFGLYAITLVGRIYLADLAFAHAERSSGEQALINYSNAVDIFPATNPFYLANYAYESALYAADTDDPEFTNTLTTQTQALAEKTLSASPNNLITTRKIANAYFLISDYDKEYKQKALGVGQKLTELAPTDPQSYLTFAKIQAGLGQDEEAIKTLETALSLKPDYQEAKELLDQLNSKAIQ